VDPDILVVDEALAVGDQHFQKKCMDRMNAFRDAGKTLVFCSHSMYLVRQLCEQTLWLKGGKLEMRGPTIEVTNSYQDYERGLDSESRVKKLAPRVPDEKDGKETFIRDVTLGGDCIDGTIDSNGRFEIRMKARIEPAMRGKAHFGIRIRRNDGVWCYGVTTELDGEKLRHIEEDSTGSSWWWIRCRSSLASTESTCTFSTRRVSIDSTGLPAPFSSGCGNTPRRWAWRISRITGKTPDERYQRALTALRGLR
jgi:hypothetical protein